LGLLGGIALSGRRLGLELLGGLIERLLAGLLLRLGTRLVRVLRELLGLVGRLVLLGGQLLVRVRPGLGLGVLPLGLAVHLLIELVLLSLELLGPLRERLQPLLLAQLADQLHGALEVRERLLVLLAPLGQLVLEGGLVELLHL